MRTVFILIAALGAAATASADDEAIALAAGGRRIVAFDRTVATFYIADPSVIDAAGLDARHIALVGKTRGRTEIVALDSEGNTVLHGTVVVTARSVGRGGGVDTAVTLQRGFERVTYACGDSHCRVAQRAGGNRAAAPMVPVVPTAPTGAPEAPQVMPPAALTKAGPMPAPTGVVPQ